jgi:diguanylate cyclase (GGDEF)-like protein/PAS domain S-box-containing protein
MPEDGVGHEAGRWPDFGALVHLSPVVIGVVDEEGVVRFVGRRGAERMMGQPASSVLGTSPTDLVHPDDLERVTDAFLAAIRAPDLVSEVTFRVTGDDGELRHLAGEFKNRFADPAIRGIVMHLVDITPTVRVSQEFEARLEAEATMAAIARDFIDRGPHDLDACINDALRAIGEVCGADRGWVFSVRENFDGFDNTHEWCRDPSRSRIEQLKGVQIDTIPRMVESLMSLEPTVLDIEHDEGLAREAALMHAPDTTTALIVPMVVDGLPVGCVGMEQFGNGRGWTPAVVSLLEQFAPLLINAIFRRAAEDARRRTESFIQGLVSGSPDVFVVVDPDGRLGYVSPSAERVLGYEPDAFIGVAVWDVLHRDDVPIARAALENTLAEPDAVSEPIEVRVRHASSRWVLCEVVGHNLVEDGRPVGVVINVRDITERRRMERMLSDAEVRFEEAWRHAPIGMVMLNDEGIVLRVNPAFAAMMGMTARGLVGLDTRTIVHPDDAARNTEVIAALLRGERDRVQLEDRLRRADGTLLWSRISMSAIRNEDEPVYLIAQVEDVTERKAFEDRLAYEAAHDGLTGLPMRKPVLEHLERALAESVRRGERLALLFIDLDNFKRINDTLGHAAGDELLQSFAGRLASAVRGMDMAARLGGDEFVVVCPGLREPHEAVAVAERLLRIVERPFRVRDLEVFVGASIGIAIADDGADAATLLRQADTAAYRAKERGRGRYEIFDDDLRAAVEQRLDVETALRRAIERDEMIVHYQPVIDVSNGAISSFEGLARWNRPGRELIEPTEFLPAAEDTGLIVPIGARVLRLACEQLAAWCCEFGADAPGMSVNLSIRQLLHSAFLRETRDALDATGVPPEKLTLEPQGPRRSPGDRRLRNRILVAQLLAPPPGRHDQDRPVVRARARPRPRRLDDRGRRHQPGARTRHGHHRRGRRAHRARRGAGRARMRPHAGLLLLPSGRGPGGHDHAAVGPAHSRRAARPSRRLTPRGRPRPPVRRVAGRSPVAILRTQRAAMRSRT